MQQSFKSFIRRFHLVAASLSVRRLLGGVALLRATLR
jgi:hypothetical protein